MHVVGDDFMTQKSIWGEMYECLGYVVTVVIDL